MHFHILMSTMLFSCHSCYDIFFFPCLFLCVLFLRLCSVYTQCNCCLINMHNSICCCVLFLLFCCSLNKKRNREISLRTSLLVSKLFRNSLDLLPMSRPLLSCVLCCVVFPIKYHLAFIIYICYV